MARLPQVGSDNGVWGQVLNEFLGQAHNSDGSLKANSVSSTQIADGSITSSKLAQGAVAQAQLPSNVVMYSLESGGSYSRPTSRTDVKVIFIGESDPGSTALTNDIWFRRPAS